MFLATTALSEFWNDQEEILFLGSWCLRYDRRSTWSRLRYQILPNPWDDRDRFHRAAAYLDACGERILGLLTDYLNAAHRVKASPRYWRILISPWLVHHLHILYDRYVQLQAAFEQYGPLRSICLDPGYFRVPQDSNQHSDWVLDDPYNLQLYSELLTQMGYTFPTRTLPDWEKPTKPNATPWGGIRRQAFRHLQKTAVSLLKHRWKAALYETTLSHSSVWKMAWQSGFRVLPLTLHAQWPSHFSRPVFDSRRTQLSCLPFQDEFERLFFRMLPQDFPSLYLEGYPAAREDVLRRLPSEPSVLLSAIAWHVHEPFKWLAAESTLKGRRLVALQHGGGYGVYRLVTPEQHEERISDSYLVWGWANQNGGHLKNVPAPQLSVLPQRLRRGPSFQKRPILFVATTNPLYFYKFSSMPQAGQMEDYFEWQFRFFRSLSPSLRSRFLFRPHLHPYPHGLPERFSERFPDLRWDNGCTFHQSLRRSSLAVIDHPSTPFLETMAANWPTVLFWDPQRWEIRQEAEPYFDALRRAGILWDSPEKAAAHVTSLEQGTDSWWRSGVVQTARRDFVEQHALTQGAWWKEWDRMLREEISLAEGRNSDD